MNLVKPMKIIYNIIDDKKKSKKIVVARFEDIEDNKVKHPNLLTPLLSDDLDSKVCNFIYYHVNRIEGKAVCCLKNDNFDLEYGFKLARKRLLSKYYKRLYTCLMADIPKMQNALDTAKSILAQSSIRKKYYSEQANYIAGMKK